jgi:hypothetical protein
MSYVPQVRNPRPTGPNRRFSDKVRRSDVYSPSSWLKYDVGAVTDRPVPSLNFAGNEKSCP